MSILLDLPYLTAAAPAPCTASSGRRSLNLHLPSFRLSNKNRVKNQLFAGVGGQVTSTTVKVFRIGIQGVHGEIHSAETPGATPLLSSRHFMEELGTGLDLGKGTVSFKKINVVDLP